MIPPSRIVQPMLLGRISGSRLNFGDLFVVTDGVERDVDQPVVGVQRSENGERMIGGVFLDGKLRVGGKLQDGDALFFEAFLYLSPGESLARHDGLGGLRFSLSKGKDAFIIRVMPSRQGKAQAPEPIVPRQGLTRAQVKERFEKQRVAILKFAADTQLPIKEHTADHPFPVFGTLNAYDWLIYVPLHTIRHDKQ